MNSTSDEIKAHTSGEHVARLYKYYRQFVLQSVLRPVPLSRVSALTLYGKHRNTFDTLAGVFNRHGVDPDAYVKFYAVHMAKPEQEIDDTMAASDTIRRYADYKSKLRKYDGILKQFNKTVDNIAEFCVAERVGAKDGLRLLIGRKMLAQWFVCGMISVYWLASIPGFGRIIPKLDHFSKCELAGLADKIDLYRNDVCRAFRHYCNRNAKPLSDVDRKIAELNDGKL